MLANQNKHCLDMTYSVIAFDERVTFWLQRVGSLPCACAMLNYLRVGLRITITQSHTHNTMQQTHTHKAVTGCVEAKKLLSHRRQSDYSVITVYKLIDNGIVTFMPTSQCSLAVDAFRFYCF